jgi:hypothetical protein
MRSAYRGADVARAWLQSPALGAKAAVAAERETCAEMRRVSWLIYRINNPVLRKLFLNPRNILRMRDAIISLLAGDFSGKLRITAPFSAFKAIYALFSLKKETSP